VQQDAGVVRWTEQMQTNIFPKSVRQDCSHHRAHPNTHFYDLFGTPVPLQNQGERRTSRTIFPGPQLTTDKPTWLRNSWVKSTAIFPWSVDLESFLLLYPFQRGPFFPRCGRSFLAFCGLCGLYHREYRPRSPVLVPILILLSYWPPSVVSRDVRICVGP
jgi:hypothetical protein